MDDLLPHQPAKHRRQSLIETVLLLMLFFVYAGDAPPMVNEAHYLVKAKNFWQPQWCGRDLFAASDKAHTTFYFLFGWPTQLVALETAAWIGRIVGWAMLAVGLRRLCDRMFEVPCASLAVAAVWIAGIQHGNLAGEWVVGGIEAKVPAYGLVLMGLAELVGRHWNRVWLYFGAASALHVLTGGWAVVAAIIAFAMTESHRPDRQPFITRSLFAGGALSLFGLVPAVWLTMGTTQEASIAAARIYSYFRIRHHLLPAEFDFAWYMRHAALILLTAACVASIRDRTPGFRRICAFTIGAVCIAIGGLLVGALPAVAPDLAARLLRFYWFRLSDAVVPLMLAIAAMQLMISKQPSLRRVGAAIVVTAVLLVGLSSIERMTIGVPPSVSHRLLGWNTEATAEEQRATFLDWQKVCYWANRSTGADEVFLTPRHQQTFKWYAGRAEVVNWKDVPQDAASIRQWKTRFEDIFPTRLGTIRVTIGYTELRRLRDLYGVRFMIVDRRVVGPHLPLVRLYPQNSADNPTYAVYELPR